MKLSRSVDGRFLVLAGYDAVAGSGVEPRIQPASAASRVVAIVNGAGEIDTSTALSDLNGGITAVASTDGNALWIVGIDPSMVTSGVHFATAGATTSTRLTSGPPDFVPITIASGRLFVGEFDNSDNPHSVFAVGSGLPTTGGQSTTPLPGVTCTNCHFWAIFFADLSNGVAGDDTLYTGIQDTLDGDFQVDKFCLQSDGTWSQFGVTSFGFEVVPISLTGSVSGTTVTLFGGGNQLITVVDPSGYNGMLSASPTILTNIVTDVFLGIAFAPSSSVVVTETDGGTSVSESGTTDTFTVVLTSTPSANVVITPSSGNVNEVTVSGPLTFTPSDFSTPQTVTVTGVNDFVVDGPQTVLISFSVVSDDTEFNNAGVTPVSVTNNDDDTTAAPTLSINNPAAVSEGIAGSTTTITFAVTLSATPATPVTVSFSTAEDSATLADNDYVTSSGSLTFAASTATLTQDIVVTVNGDDAVETDETFFVNLSGATGATIADGQGVGTIRNDDFDQCDDVGAVTCPTPAFNFNFLTTDGITYCARITNPSSSTPAIGTRATPPSRQRSTPSLLRHRQEASGATITAAGFERQQQRVSLLSVNGGAQADPHFTGANGAKFDFFGAAGGTYQTFVAPQYQVKVHLANDGPVLRFMTRVGVVFRNVTMEFGIYRYTDAQMKHFNKQLAPHGARAVYNSAVLQLDLCPGHTIVITQAHTSQPSLVHNDGSVFYYVNVEIRVPHCDDAYEGALGQTFKCKFVEHREAFQFDQATEESFRVDSLAARSSTFDPKAACVAPRLDGTPMVGGRSH